MAQDHHPTEKQAPTGQLAGFGALGTHKAGRSASTTRYAITTYLFSGVPPMKPNRPKSSEVTQKSPMSYEGFTSQINNHNFYEVFDSASTKEIKTTSQHIKRVKNLKRRRIYILIDWD